MRFLPVAVVLSLATTARAEEAESYRTQVMIGDGAALGVTIIGGMLMNGQGQAAERWGSLLVGVGIAGILVTSPAIHAIHGRWKAGGASLGLRVGMPLLATMIAAGVASGTADCKLELFPDHSAPTESPCSEGLVSAALLVGLGTGAAAALAIDYFVLAKKPIQPAVMIREGATVVGFAGSW